MTETTLGQRIAKRRKMLSISQETFGEKLGVSRQAASKWESDAAIPEIDKLITMSKLFGVSVGWLLGTEESTLPAAEEPPELSQQIQLTFQPPQPQSTPPSEAEPPEPADFETLPQPKQRHPWLITVCAVATAVSILLSLLSMAMYDQLAKKIAQSASEPTTQDPAIAELQEKLGKLKDEVAMKQAQVDRSIEKLALAQVRQDNVNDDIREFMEMYGDGTKIPTPDTLLPVYENLSKWSLTARKTTDFTKITIDFSATATVGLRSARIDVLKNGQTITSADCAIASKRILGDVTLSPDTDLEYRLILTHADHATQTITLEGHGLSDLVALSQPLVRTTPRELHLFPDKLYFSQGWLNMYVAVPHLAADDATYEWGDMQISYFQNGVQLSNYNLREFIEEHSGWDHQIPYLSFAIPARNFRMQQFEEHDVHTLYLTGTLTVNGVPTEFSVPLREWVVRDGQFFTVS